MRSVTMLFLESSWERDFSCLSINSSTFSMQEGAMSLVEVNMRLQFITICIALPVKINHNGGLLDIWDKFLMLLDQSIKFITLCFLLVLGALSHKDFQNLCEPFLHFSALKIFAQ